MLTVHRLKLDGDLLRGESLPDQPAQAGEPAASLAGEDGSQGLDLLRGRALVQIVARGPVALPEIAWHTHVLHQVQAIQPGVSIEALLDAPSDDHLTEPERRIARKVAGARHVATACFEGVPPHPPRGARVGRPDEPEGGSAGEDAPSGCLSSVRPQGPQVQTGRSAGEDAASSGEKGPPGPPGPTPCLRCHDTPPPRRAELHNTRWMMDGWCSVALRSLL